MASAPDLTRQAARYGGIVEAARRYLAMLWPRVDWTSPKAQDAVTTVYQGIVGKFGAGAASAAAELYDDMRADANANGNYRAFAADTAPDEQVAKIVASAFLGHDNTTTDMPASEQTTSDLPVEQRVQQRLEENLSRLVQQPARDTIAQNAAKDPSKARWIRVPTGPTTCEFCIMLASRELGTNFSGYRSEDAALFDENGERYHRNCDCVAAPVWGDPHQLSPNMATYNAIYEEAVERADTRTDTKAILAQMRQVINEQGQPASPEPQSMPVVPSEPVNLDAPAPAAGSGDDGGNNHGGNHTGLAFLEEFPKLPDGSTVPYSPAEVAPLDDWDMKYFNGEISPNDGGHKFGLKRDGKTEFPAWVQSMEDLQSVQDAALTSATIRVLPGKYGRYVFRAMVNVNDHAMVVEMVLDQTGVPVTIYPINGDGVGTNIAGLRRARPLDLRALLDWQGGNE